MLEADITSAVPRDEQYLWVVTRGRLLALDGCGGAAREVRLDDTPLRRSRRRRLSADDVLSLSSFDDADWEDPAVEALLDDEGVRPPPGRLRAGGVPEAREPESVLSLEERGGEILVRTSRRFFRCDPATARCKPSGTSTPVPPEEVRDEANRSERPARVPGAAPSTFPSMFGSWRAAPDGVWLVVEDPSAREELCLTLAAPEAAPRRVVTTTPFWARFLPQVSLRVLRSRPEVGRIETAVLLMLSFAPGRVAAGMPATARAPEPTPPGLLSSELTSVAAIDREGP